MAGPPAPTAEDRRLRAWKLSLPAPNSDPTSSKKLSEFFRIAAELIESGNINAQQEVLQALGNANNRGLKLVSDLLHQKYKFNEDPLPATDIFVEQLLPLFRVLTHVDVAASQALSLPRATLFNYLYGNNGENTVKILQWCEEAISALQLNAEDKIAIDASLNTLFKFLNSLIELNTLARFNAAFHAPVKKLGLVILKLAAGEHCSHDAHDALVYLDRVSGALELGMDLPASVSTKRTTVEAKTTFKISRDPPGGRHDNDFEDFSKIAILPTKNEIACDKDEYLPVTDINDNFFQGLHFVLDRSFRLLREDTVGQLRDSVHHVIHNLSLGVGPEQERRKFSARVHAYDNVELLSVEYDKDAGMALTVAFDQPMSIDIKKLRMDYWRRVNRLDPEALVCLVDESGRVLFAIVHPWMKPKAVNTHGEERFVGANLHFPKLWSDKKRGAVTLHAAVFSEHALRPLVDWGRKPTRLTLVEFPKVVLPAFKHTLEALKSMKGASDLIMIEKYLVPRLADKDEPEEVRLPTYASRAGFMYDLKCLTKDKQSLLLAPSKPFKLKELRTRTSLDDAQAFALHHALTHELALIQGPPGTGKSYLAVAMMRVLLANKISGQCHTFQDDAIAANLEPAEVPFGSDLGPIIVVTYTNHALDQTLENLLENGVDQIVRIGGRSKSEALRSHNLRLLSKKLPVTRHEKATTENIFKEKEGLKWELEVAIEKLRKAGVDTLEQYVRENWPTWCELIFGAPAEEGWTKVELENKSEIVTRWIKAGVKQDMITKSREVDTIITGSIESTTADERLKIIQFFQDQHDREIEDGLSNRLRAHEEVENERRGITDDKDLRILQAANIIGVTTSGLAKHLHLLRKLQSKVIVCEEAGEVLEAHLLTTFLPSIEHCVLIGDHLQLRPSIANYELSSESPSGEQFSLDISLFERLINPLPGMQRLPFCTLETQRRMHPSISRLVHDTLYPNLEDAENVSEYPEVAGMRKRLFWLDHNEPEGANDDEGISTSKWNDFEVKMVVRLVTHLVSQGVYSPQDISVLTPYVSQLSHLRYELSQNYAVVLDDKDMEELEEDSRWGDVSDTSDGPAVKQTALLDALRLTTIDNFQGEESAVVIVSLVRSNPEKNCGFLKTKNRINVALSRAKHGMYIIGDVDTATERSDMWYEVAKMLKEDGDLGQAFELQCSRHPNAPILVRRSEDFITKAPEGGCDQLCGDKLSCGHECLSKCHSEVMHLAVHCGKKCTKRLEACGHPCESTCGANCKLTKCVVNIHDPDRKLPCGHIVEDLPCWQAQRPNAHIPCPILVERDVECCGHIVNIPCSIDVDDAVYQCTETCNTNLACGHICQRKCYECHKVTEADEGDRKVEVNHGSCRMFCGKAREDCDHTCARFCHPGSCPPCMSLCDNACPHSRCRRAYCEPCSFLPCSKRCQEILECGHQCPSVCGEKCPDSKFCKECASDHILDAHVDDVCSTSYRGVDLDDAPLVFFPTCEHFMTAESLDLRIGMDEFYVYDKFGKIIKCKDDAEVPPVAKSRLMCPICNEPLEGLSRLKRMVLLERSQAESREAYTKSEIAVLTKKMEMVEKGMAKLQESDQLKIYARMFQLSGGSSAQSTVSQEAFAPRHKSVHVLRGQLIEYRKHLEARSTGDNDPKSAEGRARVKATAMLHRCNMLLITDFMNLRHARIDTPIEPPLAPMNLDQAREASKELIKSARAAGDSASVMQASISIIKLDAFEYQNCMLEDRRAVLRAGALKKVDAMRNMFENYDGELFGAPAELRAIEKLLEQTETNVHVWCSEMAENVEMYGPKLDGVIITKVDRTK